jgi:hypothetical protein
MGEAVRLGDNVRIATTERPDDAPRDASATFHVQFRSRHPHCVGIAKGGGP